MAFTS
ncbi:uncharacterized protein FFC1_15165 [Fusarium fujikuroi]